MCDSLFATWLINVDGPIRETTTTISNTLSIRENQHSGHNDRLDCRQDPRWWIRLIITVFSILRILAGMVRTSYWDRCRRQWNACAAAFDGRGRHLIGQVSHPIRGDASKRRWRHRRRLGRAQGHAPPDSVRTRHPVTNYRSFQDVFTIDI